MSIYHFIILFLNMPICNDTPYIHVFSILLFQSFMFGRRIGLDLSILFPPIILHSFTAETALPLFLTKHVDLAECNSIVITCSPCPLSSPRRCHLHSKRAVHTNTVFGKISTTVFYPRRHTAATPAIVATASTSRL